MFMERTGLDEDRQLFKVGKSYKVQPARVKSHPRAVAILL